MWLARRSARHRWEVGPRLAPEVEDRILAEVRRRSALGPAGRPDLPSLAWRRTVAVALAAVACALVAVGLLVPGSGPSDQVRAGPPVTPALAPPPLVELAEVARAQPSSVLAPQARYLHLVVDLVPDSDQQVAGMQGQRHERWIAADGSGRERTLPLPGQPPTGQEAEHSRGAGLMTVAGLLPSDVPLLPVDPAALLAELRWRQALRDGEPFTPSVIAELLVAPNLPGPVRAAAVLALGRSGFAAAGTATDAAGRSGALFVLDQRGGDRIEVLLDSRTARPLSVRRRGLGFSPEDQATTLYRVAEVSSG